MLAGPLVLREIIKTYFSRNDYISLFHYISKICSDRSMFVFVMLSSVMILCRGSILKKFSTLTLFDFNRDGALMGSQGYRFDGK